MQEQEQSLKAKVLWKVLDLLSGHSRPLDQKPTLSHRSRSSVRSGNYGNRAELQRRRSSVYQEPMPFPRLPPRDHCITPVPLDNETSQGPPQLNEQTESPLFRIPREIRLLIYKEVLGNRIIHVLRRKNRLGHTLCRHSLPGSQAQCRGYSATAESNCRGLKLPTGVHVKLSYSNKGIIPLLQTCRKIYADAIDVLYSTNTFDFESMETIIPFSMAILPKRFDSIQYLQLDFAFHLTFYVASEGTPSNNWERWERTWRIIGSMASLQYLWVAITWHKKDLTGKDEVRILQPLKQVRELSVFDVSLPPLRGRDSPTFDGPFRVLRRTL